MVKRVNRARSNSFSGVVGARRLKGEDLPTQKQRLRKREIAHKLLQRSIGTLSNLYRRSSPRLPRLRIRIHKPPQLVRWDLLGVILSYIWGSINSQPIPKSARSTLYRLWAYAFKVNLEEVKDSLDSYPTLKDFFTRSLKEGVRSISPFGMASPVDGQVVVCGEVTHDLVEQVKGVNYSLSAFLGRDWTELKRNPDNKLYHCVLYLAPGDYHRIHSPESWSIVDSRHFPGTLFPISPRVTRLIPNLFALNERIALSGEWNHGFFSLTAVGAYNVGSISLNFDDTVQTNAIFRDFRCPNLRYFSYGGMGSHVYEKQYDSVKMEKGDEIGLFNLGSTVVLIFESPNFEWDVQPGDKVLMGQPIGCHST